MTNTHVSLTSATDQFRDANFQIAPARNLTPRLMKWIKDFDGLEIKPCKFKGYNQYGQEIVEPCELEQVSLWVVYGHYSPYSGKRGTKVLDDFEIRGEAQKLCNILIDVCPHLAHRQYLANKRFSGGLHP